MQISLRWSSLIEWNSENPSKHVVVSTGRRIMKRKIISWLLLTLLVTVAGCSEVPNAAGWRENASVQGNVKGADEEVKNSYGITLLMSASRDGQTDIVRDLLAKGADVNAKDNEGRTALMAAAANDHADIVKLLLDRGADVNAKTKWGQTAFTLAGFFSYINIMDLLLANGAQVTPKEFGLAMIGPAGAGRADVVQ